MRAPEKHRKRVHFTIGIVVVAPKQKEEIKELHTKFFLLGIGHEMPFLVADIVKNGVHSCSLILFICNESTS